MDTRTGLRWALFIAAIALSAWTPNAQAAEFAGQQPANDQLIQQSVWMAAGWWNDQGVYPCMQPTIYTVPMMGDDGSEVGAADPSTCTIWLEEWLPTAAHTGKFYDRLMLCDVVAHEVGHLAGLGHSLTGVMQPVVPSTRAGLRAAAPWLCESWADVQPTRHPRRSRHSRACRGTRRAARTACRPRG